MNDFIIYEKPTCSTCRAVMLLMDESGRPYRKVRYYEERLSAAKLKELIEKSGLPPQEFIRTKESAWKQFGKDASMLTASQVAELLSQNPDLVERPILECGDRATVGRPRERAAAFIASCG